jgi:hypothetical protein
MLTMAANMLSISSCKKRSLDYALERVMHAERSAMDMDVQERSRGNVIPAYAGIQSP